MQAPYSLETTNLCYQYSNGDVVLKAINLQVPQGSIYGFLGPNGAGKTTTLRLILGLLKRQRGTIAIFGKSFETNRIEILRDVGSLIESPSLYDHLSASENLSVWQKVYQCPKGRIAEVLHLVGLSNTQGKKVGQFSLGMKQRLSIAVALLHRPSLLILDEPTNGLDPNGIIEIRKLLLKLNSENGITIVISSHLLAEIEKLATHLGIIHRGCVVFQGPMDELRRRQDQGLSVWFRTNNDRAALKIVAEYVPAAHLADGKIVMPAMSDTRIAQINRILIERGVEVHDIRTTSDDLEAIFMALIGEPVA
jgi:lantibiotic transport system ATP-binding protein